MVESNEELANILKNSIDEDVIENDESYKKNKYYNILAQSRKTSGRKMIKERLCRWLLGKRYIIAGTKLN